MSVTYTDGFRNLNKEFLEGLEMVTTKLYPLQGATGPRISGEIDSRLKHLSGTPMGDISYYEHIATMRHRPTNTFFVAFRETMDAFLARHALCICLDPKFDENVSCAQCGKRSSRKYPEWLMKSPSKQNELRVHIYAVTRHPNTVAVMRSIEDWLSHVADPTIFDALAQFLYQNHVINDQVLSGMR